MQYVGKYAKLRRSGAGYLACCPFADHNDKTPSFYVTDSGYKCFGCGRGGDVISFAQEYFGIPFRQALELLCQEAGVPFRRGVATNKHQELYDVLLSACELYQGALERATEVQQYLVARGLQDYRKYKLGWSGRALLPDASLDVLGRAGLVVNGRAFFHNRIMFPIVRNGKVCGFGGRKLSGGGPKYLNGPQTEVFDKSSTLYSVASLNRSLRAQSVFVVEGYMDVIALSECGFLGVAPMGTSLNQEHLRQVWAMTPRPYIAFDGDAAGARATERVLDLAIPKLSATNGIRVITLPSGMDPADLCKSGAEAWKGCCAEARDLVDVLALSIRGTPEDQQAAFERIGKQLARIEDPAVRKRYTSMLLSMQPKVRWKPRLRIAQRQSKLECIFGILYAYPEFCATFYEEIAELSVTGMYKELQTSALLIADGKSPLGSWSAASRWQVQVASTREAAEEVLRDLFTMQKYALQEGLAKQAAEQYVQNPTPENWQRVLLLSTNYCEE